MPQNDGFDAMTAACIAAYEAVKEYGSRELRVAAELLLLALGRDIAKRTDGGKGSCNGEV